MADPMTPLDRVVADLERAHPSCEVKCGEEECDARYESLLDLVMDEMGDDDDF